MDIRKIIPRVNNVTRIKRRPTKLTVLLKYMESKNMIKKILTGVKNVLRLSAVVRSLPDDVKNILDINEIKDMFICFTCEHSTLFGTVICESHKHIKEEYIIGNCLYPVPPLPLKMYSLHTTKTMRLLNDIKTGKRKHETCPCYKKENPAN